MTDLKLLVDIGNSRIKWAFGTSAHFVAQGDVPHAAGGLGDLLDSALRPGEIRIANVAGIGAGDRVAAVLRERFGFRAVFAAAAARGAGVHNGYTDPTQLGVDRWLAICAAFARFGGPICVVDAGTATTIDMVADGGEHQGGLILPGIGLMQSALLRNTGDLARLAGPMGPADTGAPHVGVGLGKDTAAAIRGGALQATASLVRTCLTRVADVPGGTLLVLTGGGAPPLGAAVLDLPDAGAARRIRLEHRPGLVLEGLALDPPCFRIAT